MNLGWIIIILIVGVNIFRYDVVVVVVVVNIIRCDVVVVVVNILG